MVEDEISLSFIFICIQGNFWVRKALILLSLFFAASCICQSSAAQSSSTNPSRPRHRAMPGGERSMRGCVAKDENGNYLLVPVRGVKVRLKDSDDVAARVGQQVKVSGAFIDADEDNSTTQGSSTTSGNPNGTSKYHPVREFRVVKIDVISQTCTAPAKRK